MNWNEWNVPYVLSGLDLKQLVSCHIFVGSSIGARKRLIQCHSLITWNKGHDKYAIDGK